ncbi:MAG: bifunctional nuclease family protein [Bacteroidetes bacterium]|nr:bifunctional nuclease family protein [Bacteroidota bacterium]
MKKIELEVIAVSHSITKTHSYAVILGEVNGSRRLPIIIGGFEAQAISVAIEKMNTSRPLTHDLMKNLLVVFGIDLHEVMINDLQEGVFYSKLVCSNEHDTIEVDSRTSDAIAMAVRYGCPIYTFEHILQNAGLLLEESDDSKQKKSETDSFEEETITTDHEDLKKMSLEELNLLLTKVLESEDYIRAIAIRDEINIRNK